MTLAQKKPPENASMIKMQIILDCEKIERDGQYTVESIERAIDSMMVDHLHLSKEGDGFYCGSNHKDDFSKFGIAFCFFRRRDWFLDNAKSWLYFNNGGSDDPEDFVIEDFKAHCLEHLEGRQGAVRSLVEELRP